MNRRGFLQAILAAGMAPAIARASSLMPIKVIDEPRVWLPGSGMITLDLGCQYMTPTYTGPVDLNFGQLHCEWAILFDDTRVIKVLDRAELESLRIEGIEQFCTRGNHEPTDI
jgi:hypothetical protein